MVYAILIFKPFPRVEKKWRELNESRREKDELL